MSIHYIIYREVRLRPDKNPNHPGVWIINHTLKVAPWVRFNPENGGEISSDNIMCNAKFLNLDDWDVFEPFPEDADPYLAAEFEMFYRDEIENHGIENARKNSRTTATYDQIYELPGSAFLKAPSLAFGSNWKGFLESYERGRPDWDLICIYPTMYSEGCRIKGLEDFRLTCFLWV